MCKSGYLKTEREKEHLGSELGHSWAGLKGGVLDSLWLWQVPSGAVVVGVGEGVGVIAGDSYCVLAA